MTQITLPDLAFNAAVTTMARKAWRNGYDVSADPSIALAPDPVAQWEQITLTKRVTVYTGGSERTIFGAPEVNYDFRAWHEWTHYILRAPFDLNGELAVAHRQCEDIALVFGHYSRTVQWQRLIIAEVYGQALWHERHNASYLVDQVAFDLEWLDSPKQALTRVNQVGTPLLLARPHGPGGHGPYATR